MSLPCDFVFSFHLEQRERFRRGDLVRDWSDRYPQLFDQDDIRVLTTEHQRRYHFFEWLSAVLLFEATGYYSMVEKYTSKSHPEKLKNLGNILPQGVFSWVCQNESGQPDLFVYEPTSLDWFFCEVKGGADVVRDNQIEWMEQFKMVLKQEDVSPAGKMRVLCLQSLC